MLDNYIYCPLNYLIIGILWPLEGMPDALRQISLFLPNTYPCQAMRDIMLRGWDIEREAVYMGVGFSSFRIPCDSSFTPYCVLSTVHHFCTILDIKSSILTLSIFFMYLF